MKKTNIEFTEFALSHAKNASVPAGAMLLVPCGAVGDGGEWEYLYGTTGHKITKALLDVKFDTYYIKNGWTREDYDKTTAGFIGRIACDCQGLLDKFCGDMDINAEANWQTCTSKGKVKTDEHYVIGECLFVESKTTGKKTHVGFVCGYMPDGEELIVEERGIRYGCVVTKRSERPWTHHGRTKYLEYVETYKLYGAEPMPFEAGEKSDDVKQLQELLNARGFAPLDGMPLTVDGVYGERTADALAAFIAAQYPVKVLVGENVVYTNKKDK